MPADARIYIKIDVDNKGALAKLAASRKAVKSIDDNSRSYAGSVSKLERHLAGLEKQQARNVSSWHKHASALHTASRASHVLKSAGGALAKMMKWGSIEFGVMTLVLGGLKLALVAGRAVMKAFHSGMLALGGAAGVAVAALSGVLGVMRELAVAKMMPQFKSVYGMTPPGSGPENTRYRSDNALIGRTMKDKRFGMFSDAALQQTMSAQLGAGQQVGGAFRSQLARLGDFTGGDEKSLIALNEAMAKGAKAGKITTDVYALLAQGSPAVAAAFEEMAGGADKAEGAAANGSISFASFHKTLMEGKLKSLEPYNGALNEINNTAVGKFKSGIRVIKEQLTEVSQVSANALYGSGEKMSIVDAIKAPIDSVIITLSSTITAITPILQQLAPKMFNGVGGAVNGMSEMLIRNIVPGMQWLSTFGVTVNGWIGTIRGFFTSLGSYLEEATGPFDRIMDTVLKPFMSLVGYAINQAIMGFGGALDKNGKALASWGESFITIKALVKGVFEAIGSVKAVLTPIVTVILQIFGVFGKMLAVPIIGMFGKLAIGALLLYGVFGKITAAITRWRAGISGSHAAMAAAISDHHAMAVAINETTVALERALIALRAFNAGGRGGRGGPPTGPLPLPPGQTPPGQTPPGQTPPGQTPPGQTPPGQTPPGQTPPAQLYGWRGLRSKFFGDSSLQRTDAGYYNQGQYSLTKNFNPETGQMEKIRLGEGRRSLISLRDEGYANMNPVEQRAKRMELRSKVGSAATMGAMMVGGMITSSAGDSKSQAALGNSISGAGMGGMLGSMSGVKGGTAMGAGAGAALMLGNYIKQNNAKTSTGAQVGGGFLQGAGAGAGIGMMVGAIGGPAGAAIGAAIGAGIGGTLGAVKGYFDAGNARKKETADQIAAGGMIGREGGFDSKDDFKKRSDKRFNTLSGLRGKEARLKALGNPAYKEGKRGLLKEAYDDVRDATSSKAKKDAQKVYDALLAEQKSLESGSAERKNAMVGLVDGSKDQKTFIKEGRTLAANLSTGKMFGLSPGKLQAYADKHGIKLQKLHLGIKAMVDMTGYSMDAADSLTNLGMAAKRLSVQAEELFAPERAKASAIIAEKSGVADYLTNLNQSQTKEESYLASTDALTLMSKSASAMLASGAFGKSNDPNSYKKYQAYLSTGIDELMDSASRRPGATKDNLNTLLATGTELKTKVTGPQSMSDRSKVDSALVQEIAAATDASAKDIKAKSEQMKLAGKSDKEIQEFQTKTLKKSALETAFIMKAKYSLTDDIDKLSTNLASTTAATVVELGGTVFDKTFTSIQAGSDYMTEQLRIFFEGTSLELKDNKWVWKKSVGGPGDTKASSTGAGYTPTPRLDYESDASKMLLASGAFPELDKPGWWNDSTPVDKGGRGRFYNSATTVMADTSSSRFNRTFAKHAALTSMLPGKRTITSGLRNFNLGSPSSDHLTGNAYDLTGDNLGSYAGLVNASGGFAEFHGAAASRHLHVVPAHGDTSSPRAGGMAGGTVNNSYSIVVNGGPGSSPAEIADQVMVRIQRANRDMAERS